VKLKKTLFWLFFFLGLFQLLYSFGKVIARGIYLPDFAQAYYQVGSNLRKGINPYRTSSPILYPPFSLLVFALLGYFPLNLIQLTWSVFSFLALLISIRLILTSCQLKSANWFLFLAPLAFLSFPVKFTLGMGQINNFILLLFSLSFYFYQKEKINLSSFFFSLSLLIKLTPVWIFLFFIKKKEWRVFKRILLFLVLGLGLSFLILPRDIFKDFFFLTLPSFKSHFANSAYYNQALTGLISRLWGRQAFLVTLIGLIFIFLSWLRIGQLNSDHLKFSLLITLGVLIAPVSWQHHLVFLFFPIIVLFTHFLKAGKKTELLILAFAYFLIAFNFKNPSIFETTLWGRLLLSHAVFGTLLVYFLIFFANKRELNLRSCLGSPLIKPLPFSPCSESS